MLEAQDEFLLIGHKNPDGDAVGSCLSLGLLLQQMGKQVHVAFPSPPPEWWRRLPGSELVTEGPPHSANAAIAVDCDGIDRLQQLGEVFLAASHRAEMDHHTGEQRCSAISYVDATASAVGVLVYRTARTLSCELTAEIATGIYLAIATDTGFFRYANTNGEALRIGGECVDAGVDAKAVADLATGNRPLAHLVLKGLALRGLSRHLDGRVLIGTLTPADFATAHAERSHAEAVIDDIKSASDTLVYALFKAAGPDDEWDVSLRSEAVDCAAVARDFDGGGHAAAAGYTCRGALAHCRDNLLTKLAEFMSMGRHVGDCDG